MLTQFRRLPRLRRFATVAAKQIKEKPPAKEKAPRTTKETKRWEDACLKRLERELKADKSRYTRIQDARATHGQIIKYTIAEDVSGILSLAEAALRARPDPRTTLEDRDAGIDTQMLVSFSLLLARRLVVRDTASGGGGRAEIAAAALANMLTGLRSQGVGEELKAAVALLWETLSMRGDERLAGVLRTSEETCRRIIKEVDLSGSRLLMTEEERGLVLRRLRAWRVSIRTEGAATADDGSYDQSVGLVRALRLPMTPEEYLGNPFAVEGLGQDQLLALFAQQLQRDRVPWIEVRNIFMKTRPPGVVSAEKLVESWRWKGSIEKELVKALNATAQHHIRSLLSSIPAGEAAAIIHSAILAALGQGQGLLTLQSFQYSLALPLLEASHDSALRQMEIDDRKLVSSVFSDYCRYFVDGSIARSTTHRQWWATCAAKHGLAPDFEVPLRRFDHDTISRLGAFVQGVVETACRYPRGLREGDAPAFATRTLTEEEESQVRAEGRLSASKMVAIAQPLLDTLAEHQFDSIAFPSWQLPMIVPPRPWLDRGGGGATYAGTPAECIRNLSEFGRVEMNHEMRTRLKSNSQGRPVWDALNALGSTAWIINRPVLGVLKQLFSMSNDPTKAELLTPLTIPMSGTTIAIPSPAPSLEETSAKDKAAWRTFYKERDAAMKDRNEATSLWYWMLYRLVLAEHFADTTLYFPHNMDFRGRVYPISPLLNHMGDDVNRSILRFARGKPLGPRGLGWLKVHCINLTGKLKRKSMEERAAVAEETLPLMIDSAERPLDGSGWWRTSEEPWQTLAACIELRDALAAPNVEAFVSHLPVHQDGSCNGLQHYAALGRDKGGGSEVNLLPAPVPSDVYSSVAARVETRRKADEARGDETAIALRAKMPEDLPRKVIKQTVMTTVYGVTMYGAKLQIKKQLKALGMEGEEASQFSTYLAKHAFSSLSDAFTSSMQLKDWLRACAKGVGELMAPVEWVTPLGLPVMQPYLKNALRKGRLVLLPISSKQIDAFPPNLVHSLDSTHMMLTALHVARAGMTFAAVHDCFWTHAADVDAMGVVCREQFVALHSEDLVTEYSRHLKEQYLPLVEHPDDRARFEKLFTPEVAPGELDIRDVLQSVYFFS